MPRKKTDLLQGTLDMLILKALELEPMHGYGLSLRLEQLTDGVFQVNAGSVFPALYRMERDGWIRGAWRTSENNRRAKYYDLTARGRRQLERETRSWERAMTAVGRVLEST